MFNATFFILNIIQNNYSEIKIYSLFGIIILNNNFYIIINNYSK